MGWGDEIMVTAEARRMQANDPRPVAVCHKRTPGAARWHEIWNFNPRFAVPEDVQRKGAVQWLRNFGGARPYIDYEATTDDRYVWRREFRAEPGEIYLCPEEKRFAESHEGAVIIEPNVKSEKQQNKDWGWENWVRLTELLPRVQWVQLGPNGIRMLARARQIKTNSVRFAAAVVSKAKAVVTAEGGLHHCAAAFGTPAVVIFGGFISPATTGYSSQVSFFTGGEACGMRIRCEHCREAMARITPEQVAEQLWKILEQRRAA